MRFKLLAIIGAITLLVSQAQATWFYYDGGNGTGWQYYGYYPSGDPDQTFYYPNLAAAAAAYRTYVATHHLP